MKKVCFLSLFCDRLYCCRCIFAKKENYGKHREYKPSHAPACRSTQGMGADASAERKNASATRISPMATSGAT